MWDITDLIFSVYPKIPHSFSHRLWPTSKGGVSAKKNMLLLLRSICWRPLTIQGHWSILANIWATIFTEMAGDHWCLTQEVICRGCEKLTIYIYRETCSKLRYPSDENKIQSRAFIRKCWCLLGNYHVASSPRQSTNSATIGSPHHQSHQQRWLCFFDMGWTGSNLFRYCTSWGLWPWWECLCPERMREKGTDTLRGGRNYRTISGKKREGPLKVCYRFHYHINTLSIQIWRKGEEQKALGESRRSAVSYHIGIMRVVRKCSTGIQVGGIDGLQHSHKVGTVRLRKIST